MKTATDPRHQHRVKLMKHLYASSFKDQSDPTIKTIWDHKDQIDNLIKECAPEWPIDKLNPLDLAILRLSIYELIVDKQAPYKVIIDEAVELAKEFGSESSPSFINGALGKLIKDLYPQNNNESES
jgi:N utilization substance protein B